MSFSPTEEPNPFEAPRAGIGERFALAGGDVDAELIRRAHIGREASIKSIGSLYFFSSIICALAAIFFAAGLLGGVELPNAPQGFTPELFRVVLVVAVVGFAALAALCGAVGYGLQKLQAWARWTVVVLIGLNFLVSAYQVAVIGMTFGAEAAGQATGGTLVVSLIPIFILWIVGSSKANVVFSAGYKEVIARTPQIKQKTSLVVKILLSMLLTVLGLLVLAAIFSALRR